MYLQILKICEFLSSDLFILHPFYPFEYHKCKYEFKKINWTTAHTRILASIRVWKH